LVRSATAKKKNRHSVLLSLNLLDAVRTIMRFVSGVCSRLNISLFDILSAKNMALCMASAMVRKNNYLLAYSMEKVPSREPNRFSASQEIPRIVWNPKVPN